MRWSAIPILVLLVLAAPLPAQDAAPDILSVTPEELGGVDAKELLGQAHAAYQEKRYEDAARAFIEALRARPGDSGSIYNLACCYGLLGHAEQAAAFLQASWKAGFRDLGHIEHDVDFASVRESDVFQAAMKRLAEDDVERQALTGEKVFFATEGLADMLVLPPDEVTPWAKYPLVVGLHGFGSNPEDFVKIFRGREVAQPFYFCAVRAPYAMNLGAETGYSWDPDGAGDDHEANQIGHRASIARVLRAIEEMKRLYPVDEGEVFLLGFSQGAGLTNSVGLQHPGLFRGIIPIGGWLDDGELDPMEREAAAQRALVLWCHSPEDARVEYEGAQRALAFLKNVGVRHSLLRYEGGHSVPKELVQEIVKWIEKPHHGQDHEVKRESEEE